MMPPKKSKAAREMDNGSPARGKGLNGEAEGEEADRDVDIFRVEIMSSKRERTIPPTETVFQQWINDNFEDKEGMTLNMNEVYEHYLDMCTMKQCNAVEQHRFIRGLKESYPGGFTTKESSVLFGQVKERKIAKKRPKVEGETMKLKMRDIVTEQLDSMGNPKTGVRFNMLVKLIGAKYPALRLDINPRNLLTALDSGIRYGKIYVTKGVGKCGFYRLWKPGMENESDEEDDKKKDKKEKKEEGIEGEGSAEDGEKESAGEGGEKSGEEGDGKKKRKRKPKKRSKPRRANIVHSAPQRVRDCFPLAMTYMNEPKTASARKIKTYLEDYYDFNNDARLKKTLEEGVEKGWWNLLSGSAMGGTYELLIMEFDPTDDEDVVGKIVNALTACSEPKTCSANALKSYIVDYHPDFKVSERPFLFKRAMESAVNDDELRQVSGLGCTGSFQLVETFIPGPRILAGKDTESDYEEVTSDDDDSDLDEADAKGFDVAYFQTSNYVPRPSKRRGKARNIGPIEKLTYTPTETNKRKRKATAKRVARGGGKRGKYTEDTSEEEDSEEEEEEESEEEEEDSDNEYSRNAEKYQPRPSKSRGGGGGGRGRAAPASPAKKQPAKGRGRPAAAKGRGRPASKAAAAPAQKAAPAKGRGKGRKRRR